jgi:hypothetical protein
VRTCTFKNSAVSLAVTNFSRAGWTATCIYSQCSRQVPLSGRLRVPENIRVGVALYNPFNGPQQPRTCN